jgi:hypothetical protein
MDRPDTAERALLCSVERVTTAYGNITSQPLSPLFAPFADFLSILRSSYFIPAFTDIVPSTYTEYTV